MAIRLKHLKEQVLLITGASSGIGLMTAQTAARRGAKVFMVSRSEAALRKNAEQINAEGGEAGFAVADVATLEELRRAADQAVQRFGRIDTWVNNAGVSIYGRIADTKIEDDKRLFETNFWGVVNGSRLAAEYLKNGGAIINIGSVLSDRAVPVQGMYSASKHAVLGFTDAFRMELEDARLPISVTTIKPSAINTPYVHHAKNYMPTEPSLPAPVYEPEIVAEQILHAATHPVRQLYAGGGGWLLAKAGGIAPRLTDFFMEKTQFKQQRSDNPARHKDTLHSPDHDAGQARGDIYGQRMVRRHSLFSLLTRHPLVTLAAIGAAGAVGAAAVLMHEKQARHHRHGGPLKQNLRKYGSRVLEGALPLAARSFFR